LVGKRSDEALIDKDWFNVAQVCWDRLTLCLVETKWMGLGLVFTSEMWVWSVEINLLLL
jgi:hypothetical protein